MTRKYFGTDGVRGKVGEFPITPEFAMKLGWAAGRVLSERGTRKVLIGKDTRISGYLLETAMEAGLVAAGIDVRLLGPMPTPAIAYLTRTFRAEAGIVISASHNPYYDNGIKFFSADGTKLPDDVERAIEDELEQSMVCVSSEKLGKVFRINDAAGRYIEFCKSHLPNHMSLNGLKIVIDCAHGATYHIAPAVFKELGATVIVAGCSPDGLNINDQCGATHTALLQQLVTEHKADLGIAYDGDGDRVMMADHTGRVIDGDEIVYMIARSAKETGRLQGGVVGTLMSNMGLELALQKLDIPFARSAVGDRYVMELLREKNWRIGGENSGHVLNLDHTCTGDGIIASLQVLTAMIETRQTLAELSGGMHKLPQVLVNVKFEKGTAPLEKQHVKQVISDVEAELNGTGRVLIRKSGTEPLIRVMVEGEDAAQVRAYAEKIAAAVKIAS
ncbi:phosphoglucosamine mutase [Chromatiaceae bacterium AAb-1]|nr:phosphoglucosamine mutase [Chromatiaceae bacterium AAb-1]